MITTVSKAFWAAAQKGFWGALSKADGRKVSHSCPRLIGLEDLVVHHIHAGSGNLYSSSWMLEHEIFCCTFPSCPSSLLSHPDHLVCLTFMLSHSLPWKSCHWFLPIGTSGFSEVAHYNGPHLNLLSQPWLCHLQRFACVPLPACLNVDTRGCHF